MFSFLGCKLQINVNHIVIFFEICGFFLLYCTSWYSIFWIPLSLFHFQLLSFLPVHEGWPKDCHPFTVLAFCVKQKTCLPHRALRNMQGRSKAFAPEKKEKKPPL